jgi:hypothetical protein
VDKGLKVETVGKQKECNLSYRMKIGNSLVKFFLKKTASPYVATFMYPRWVTLGTILTTSEIKRK